MLPPDVILVTENKLLRPEHSKDAPHVSVSMVLDLERESIICTGLAFSCPKKVAKHV